MKNTGWFGIAAAIVALFIAVTCTAATDWQKWPTTMPTSDGLVVIYQPQIESFKGDNMTARAAVSIKISDAAEPVFGVIWFASRVDTDRASRTVDLVSTRVTRVKFADDVSDAAKLAATLETNIPRWDIDMSLDEVLTSLELVEREQKASEELKNEPPKIIFYPGAALLVVLDGEPKMVKMENTDLMRVANTPFIMVFATRTRTYYLKAGETWMKTRDIDGTWQAASEVPSAAVALSEEKDVAGATGMTTVATPADGRDVPKVIIATEPTELVAVDGEPQFQTIAGTSLLYVSNTDNDLFMDIDSQNMYVLLAGRWFTAKQKEGPWKYIAADRLPATFSHIPAESAKGDVLASVTGTQEAQEAVADTYIPQTAAVRRSDARLAVVYDGSPKFEVVAGTPMRYAVNTSYNVILAEGAYYCCDNAVWFVSASAYGPWAICDRVPNIIYNIPPNCPVYPVKYVYIYDSTPEVVYVGYTPGYVGSYVYNGCVVYGTGHHYRGWYSHVYYPRPLTWGLAFRYNTFAGWSIGVGIDFGGCFGVTRVNYVSGGWWGNGGFRLHDRDFPRRSGFAFAERRHDVIDRRDDFRHDRVINVYNRRNDVMPHPQIADLRTRVVPATSRDDMRNDVFADRNGDVHRRNADNWETRQNRGWTRDSDPRSGHDTPDVSRGSHNSSDVSRASSDRNQSQRIAPDEVVTPRRAPDKIETPRKVLDRGDTPRSVTDRIQAPRADSDKGMSPRVIQQRVDTSGVTEDKKLPQREVQGRSDVQRSALDKTVQPRISQKPSVPAGTPDKAPTIRQPDQKSDLDQQMRARVRGQERTKTFDNIRNAQTATTPGNDAQSRAAVSPRSAGNSKDDSTAGPKDRGSSASSKDRRNDSKDSTSSSKDNGDNGRRGGNDRNR